MVTSITLICKISLLYCLSKDAQAIARAIDRVTDDPRLRAIMVVYAKHEGGFELHPRRAWSRDALRGQSCDFLQEPCAFTAGKTPEAQAAAWLRWVQASSLGAVDSLWTRAFARIREAERLLRSATESETTETREADVTGAP